MNEKKISSWAEMEKGILQENPVFVLLIGLCSSLAVSANVSSALAIGISLLAVLTCSNIFISALCRFIPNSIRIPAFIIIIAGFTTIVEIIMGRYFPVLYDILGVYLPLIVVNCIILGRAESFASKNNVWRSALDGIGMGIGYTLALVSIAFLRELLGNGTLSFQIAENVGVVLNFTYPVLQDNNDTIVNVINLFGTPAPIHTALEPKHLTIINIAHIVPEPLQLMKLPPGGFLVMGLYLAIIQQYALIKAEKKKKVLVAAAKAKRDAKKIEKGE